MKPRRSQAKAAPESSTSTRQSVQNEDAWALSLYDTAQAPLNVMHPIENVFLLRRSLRSTPSKYRTPLQKSGNERNRVNSLTELITTGCRSSFPSGAVLKLVDERDVGSGSRKRGHSLTDNDGQGPPGNKVILSQNELIIRRSPRRSGGKYSSSNIGLIVYTRKKSGSLYLNKSCFTKKCSRSGTVLTPVGDSKKTGRSCSDKIGGILNTNDECLTLKRCLKKSGEVSENFTSGTESTFRMMNLRSCVVKIPVENEERKGIKKSRTSESNPKRTCCNIKSTVYPSIEMLNKGNVLRNKSAFRNSESSNHSLKEMLAASNCRSKGEWDCDDSKVMRVKSLRPRVHFKEQLCGVGQRTGNSIQRLSSPENGSIALKKIKPGTEEETIVCCFVGMPFPAEVARERWHWRYELKQKNKNRSWKLNAGEEDEVILNVDSHYAQARIGSCILDIGDCVYVKGEGTKKHIGRILEFFKTVEGEDYFRVQWFFRAEDTVLKDAASSLDKKRLFYSTLMNDNILDCIISKVKVVKVPPSINMKPRFIKPGVFYYDMEYCIEYSSFRSLLKETSADNQLLISDTKPNISPPLKNLSVYESLKSSTAELWLLDLYSGCGGMSTGLCIGAKLSRTNLVTKWAVDQNTSACESLRLNHPETVVRNENAEDFFILLRQWKKLCSVYLRDTERKLTYKSEDPVKTKHQSDEIEYEVSHLVAISYGDPCETGKRRLYFKVHWKGYSSSDDTWEPLEALRNCQEMIRDFVAQGFESKILPLPGDVDVICGGPPCQGISGYNRFRNTESPFADERNRQIAVFMDIVDFLKPKYVLMENVVDIIKFDRASFARYALSRLVGMKYQARLGTMASGCYGLPQFRLRVFIWGSHPCEKLPQFPLPTHEVIVKYWPPVEFERNIVAYDEGQPRNLKKAILLRDSISDLPLVTNYENREKMVYEKQPETDFQTYIRLSKDDDMGMNRSPASDPLFLYDHRPFQLSEHDILRVSKIPHRKGANFRDLPGIIVGPDNVARRDPKTGRIMLPTGKLLVPDCSLNYEQGKSKTPYGRLWWDETVSTLLTFPNIRRQAFLHPEQDRILSIRESARLQGFPDFYRFCGSIRERYQQIGNAVSIPVARALGYTLGMAYQRVIGEEPLMILPPNFAGEEVICRNNG